ncbi:MAG: ribosomal protein S18-alanine N-acetyltransferase [Pseudomonadota bacterium]
MSAVLKPAESIIRPMDEKDLYGVMAIEERAYQFPWSKQIFLDCLNVGYCCWVVEQQDQIVAYGIMTVAVGESHVLNLCVSPDHRSQGLGKQLMMRLLEIAQDHDVNMTFLEVRPSNFAAISLYTNLGFNEVGTRRNYYPAKIGREDALVLARTFTENEQDADG